MTGLAIRAGQLSRGEPLLVVLSLAVTTAVLSAFLDNVTTILLIVPITFLLADALDVNPVPLIMPPSRSRIPPRRAALSRS